MFAKPSPVFIAKSLGLAALSGAVLALIVLLHPTSVKQEFPPGVVPVSPQALPDVTRETLSCDITMAKVAVSDPPLAVRLAANSDPATQIVAHLDDGAFVTVGAERQNWLLIQSPVTGWVPKSATEHSCNQKVELMTFSPQGGKVAVHDRFVGSGRHWYRMNLKQGQTVTINGKQGLLPFLLNSTTYQPIYEPKSTEDHWSVSIPATGHYLLELDSHSKGFDYDFTLQVNQE